MATTTQPKSNYYVQIKRVPSASFCEKKNKTPYRQCVLFLFIYVYIKNKTKNANFPRMLPRLQCGATLLVDMSTSIHVCLCGKINRHSLFLSPPHPPKSLARANRIARIRLPGTARARAQRLRRLRQAWKLRRGGGGRSATLHRGDGGGQTHLHRRVFASAQNALAEEVDVLCNWCPLNMLQLTGGCLLFLLGQAIREVLGLQKGSGGKLDMR